MLEDQKKIMTEVWEEELRRIEAEKATLKDQVHYAWMGYPLK